MIAATQTESSANSSEAPRFQSAMFQFPGRPLPLARRLAVYNRVKRILRDFMEEQRYNEVPAPAAGIGAYLGQMIDRGFPAVWSECQIEGGEGGPAGETRNEIIGAMGTSLDEDALLLLERTLMENVVENLSADLLGGRQITRLDRVLTCEHPRLTYEEACGILNDHGHPIRIGAALSSDDEAALSRLCHNQPLLITGLPLEMAVPGLLTAIGNGPDVKYHGVILPYSGLTYVGCEIPGERRRGGFTLNLGRLLQFLMGLGTVQDTVISPQLGMAKA